MELSHDSEVSLFDLALEKEIPETFPLPTTQALTMDTQIPETFPLPETQFSGDGNSNSGNVHNFKTNYKQNSFPSNSTLNSLNQDNVVIFRQTDASVSNNKTLTMNSILLAKFFAEILPDRVIKDVRINRRRNVVAVELEFPSTNHIQTLLNVTNIGEFVVQGYRPAEGKLGKHTIGVIGPVDLDVDIDELKELLSASTEILKVTRLAKFRDGAKTQSMAVKIDFAGDQMPSKVKVGYISYTVREYNPPPLRCFKCQRFGHLAGGCTSKTRCLICGGDHQRESCNRTNSPRCVNCGKDHIASSRDCLMNRKSSMISKLTKQGLSFAEARKEVDLKLVEYNENPGKNRSDSRQAQVDRSPETAMNDRPSYSSVVSNANVASNPAKINQETKLLREAIHCAKIWYKST